MADLNPTGRFSSRVDDYSRYRPSYPPEIVPLLEHECGLTAESTIADIGAGTGLLAKLFLEFGCRVIGVEPNKEMREAGEQFLARHPKFTSINGRAEQSGLADASVNLVTAGQAFHWFDAAAARREFARILRDPKWVALIWNEREVTGGFLTGYEQLLRRYAPDYHRVDHRQIGGAQMDDFFGEGNWKLATFPNVQEFDLEGVRGRLRSSSYAPHPGDAAFEPMMSELDGLFHKHQRSGSVAFLYKTNVYYAALHS
ncbi:MAG TPA: class I SAM-dependent methyltransferase [Bryobacteraceae bacterium]|nr:class I SAM-dependent methyltransferase [Bryobacteraceae bacterium]